MLAMTKSMPAPEDLSGLAREVKALVAMAFRNGPIENVHAGKTCPTCQGKPEYSHITPAEMREIRLSLGYIEGFRAEWGYNNKNHI